MINKKSSIIKKVLGSKLEEEGFEYQGYNNKTWIFRKKGEVNQEILILEYRYDSSYYTLLLSGTSAIPASMLDSSEKFMGEYWHIENDDDFEALIKYFLELIKTKGLDELKKVNVVSKNYIVLNNISKDIYDKREEIFERFIEKHPQLPVDDYSLENINIWFDFIEKEYDFYSCGDIINFSEKDLRDFEDVSVFLSTMLEKHLSGVWVKYDFDDECSVVIDKMCSVNKTINIVAILNSVIERGNLQIIKSIFEDIYRNRIVR